MTRLGFFFLDGQAVKKIWHPYWSWEDLQMWRKVSRDEEIAMLEKAIEFTGNADLYGQWMMRVIDSWPVACEHNLSDDALNQQAWIGHAACQMAIDCPEYITRKAWGILTEQQRIDANLKADKAIYEWKKRFSQKTGQLHIEMEAEGV